MKRVILITGTPCVGKTTIAKQLNATLNGLYINLTDFAKAHRLILGEDEERKTLIINEEKMRTKLTEVINSSHQTNIIVDGHYAASVVPERVSTHVFVLRRNPIELKQFMRKCGFDEAKVNENLSAEILDVCLIEALQTHKGKVCELDITGKTAEEVTNEILEVIEKGKKCHSGTVDWLGMLELEGLTDQYLKV
jgi:adenylate kinase